MKDASVYEFGSFRLEAIDRRLLRHGTPVPLTAKVFNLLLLLVQNSGHLVYKEEIMNHIWPDSFVEENNLTVSISILRRALNESAESQYYIETVKKSGYRFAAPVKVLTVESHAAANAEPLTGPTNTAGEEPIRSIAVMPFINVEDKAELEYLSEGITESIINSLAQLPQLKVIARSTVFRYKGAKVEPLEAGRRMRVRAVLTGRMLQLADCLVISTELIDLNNETQIWGEQFIRQPSQILDVQEEIAWEISRRLRLKLSDEEQSQLRKRPTQNIEAYQLYLQGRYFWGKYTRKGLEKAIDYFNKAIEKDSKYALAYTGMAWAYYRLSNMCLPPKKAMPEAKAAALKALEIDPQLGNAQTILGMVKALYNYDWEEAKSYLQRGVDLDPDDPFAHSWYGWVHAVAGRFDEAMTELNLALKLDPLSLQIHVGLAGVFTLYRRYDEAIERLNSVIEMDSYYFPAHGVLADCYMHKGMFTEAISELQLALSLEDNPQLIGRIGYAYAISGRERDAEEMICKLRERSESQYISPYYLATIYAGLGRKDEALKLLHEAYEDRSEAMCLLKLDPKLDSLRTDPGFESLRRSLG
jgi:DNA-binding winged helix-turn-helix (wHTH) protein/Tfp pilus assembly protein PilF